jgi:hypothetical protein
MLDLHIGGYDQHQAFFRSATCWRIAIASFFASVKLRHSDRQQQSRRGSGIFGQLLLSSAACITVIVAGTLG